MKLTAAERRGLEAVRDCRVFRRYTSKGNIFICPFGIGASVMWRLERMNFIRDGKNTSCWSVNCLVELTDQGRRYLWENSA